MSHGQEGRVLVHSGQCCSHQPTFTGLINLAAVSGTEVFRGGCHTHFF